MISAILTELMVFSTNSTAAYSRFGRQQFTVQDAFSRLNRDIEGAEKISFEDCIAGNEYKTISLTINGELRKWKFDGGKLYFDSTVVVEGLTDESKFVYNLTEKNLTVILMPESTNEGRFRFNLKKPVVSQYSLFYKNVN
ncbi:hypothetical protein Cst_c12650 [Thermoclostridium stercorarium subsp. stercorarium DSM 8532]|jgi:hypothetical protein|uniref:Uncharacterized protein n=3 Tax=Thermoclostridium stercorarium TaxID=1510 RepID=L7VP87_THES1|nr:hypothetical protein [Thermoclostridium stercorarium]AGC68256.1 hypothetical protein Cst_c12650 [Thermoclostridium stercorarium subsp. stercorarium DSM 8532]AGI39283.1 hypothetical protein Clst_1222 [Thermoclostridium stercorarium subsp. stercorarium DSM 8532]ANW98617.1 hypothetical protein CSTERTH_06000 [Thermoclostridium stercorarium subsp. thermolacticum DSM 2910]ANX01159.1 hypothetical protein CSTERLE_06010 [Thermoclostridium stercorarium subsp. leptospartum DSM 9219]UZQ86772.1 hypothet